MRVQGRTCNPNPEIWEFEILAPSKFRDVEEAPPFAVIAAGPLHTLPEPPSRAERTMPTVQFAAGMIHDEATGDLVISYSTMDCGAHLTRVPMESVLRATGLVW